MDLDYVKIVGRLGITRADGSDPNEMPDTVWCDTGTVRFEPILPYTRIVDGTPVPWTAGHSIITASIDPEGYVSLNGTQGVWLIDLGSDKVNPKIPRNKGAYRVSFNGIKADGSTVEIPSFVMHPIPGVDNDITLMLPLPVAGGQSIVQGPRGDRGDDGVSVDSLDVEAGNLLVSYSDGSETNLGPLPVGPGGSDEGVASYLASETSESRVVLNAAFGSEIGTDGTPARTALNNAIGEQIADPESPAGQALTATIDTHLTSLGGVFTVVNQGLDADADRPTGSALTRWTGSARPANGADRDEIFNPTTGMWEPLGALLTPTIRQAKKGSVLSGTTLTVTLDTRPITGNTIIALTHVRSSNTESDITAPAGWTRAASMSASSTTGISAVWTFPAGGPTSFTLTAAVADATVVQLIEVDGGSSVIDTVSTSSSAPNVTTATIGPTQATLGSFAIALVGGRSTFGSPIGPWTDGFTQQGVGDTGGDPSFMWATKQVTTTGPLSTSVTWPTPRSHAAILIAFRPKRRPSPSGFVRNYMNPLVARPAVDAVRWFGSVQPVHMMAPDSWVDTTLRFTTTQGSGERFHATTGALMTWAGPGDPEWTYGTEAVSSGARPDHTWATPGPHVVEMRLPAESTHMTGTLTLAAMKIAGPIEDMRFPAGLTGSLQLHDNAITGDIAKARLPQGLTTTLSLRNNSIGGNLEQARIPQGLTATFHIHNNQMTGDLTKVALPQGLTGTMYLSYNPGLTGDVAGINFPRGVKVLAISQCSLTGDLTKARLPVGLTTCNFYNNNLTGNLAELMLPTTISDTIYLQTNNFHGVFDISRYPAVKEVNLNGNPLITQANVDAMIDKIYAARATFTTGPHKLRIEMLPDPSAPALAKIVELTTDPNSEGFPLWEIDH